MRRRGRNVVLVEGVNCFGVIVLSSSHIMGCRLDKWEDLMEYMVQVVGEEAFIKRFKY